MLSFTLFKKKVKNWQLFKTNDQQLKKMPCQNKNKGNRGYMRQFTWHRIFIKVATLRVTFSKNKKKHLNMLQESLHTKFSIVFHLVNGWNTNRKIQRYTMYELCFKCFKYCKWRKVSNTDGSSIWWEATNDHLCFQLTVHHTRKL